MSLTNFPRMTHSLGRQVAKAGNFIFAKHGVSLFGAVSYGTQQTVEDRVVIAVIGSKEFRYHVTKLNKATSGEGGYAIKRFEDFTANVLREECALRYVGKLPTSLSRAAEFIAIDARDRVTN